MGNDESVMPHIDQANIACGFHGGDPLVMQKTLAMAIRNDKTQKRYTRLCDRLGQYR